MGVEAASSLAAELDDSNRRAVELEQAHDVSFEKALEENAVLPTHERGRPLLPPEERSHRLASMFGSAGVIEVSATPFLAGNLNKQVKVAIGRWPDPSLVFGTSVARHPQKYRNQVQFHLPRHRLTENEIRK